MRSTPTHVFTFMLMVTAMTLQAAATAAPVTHFLCDGREGCELSSSVEAGADEDGNRLTVLELRFQELHQVKWRAEPPEPHAECRPYPREFWVVVRDGDEVVATSRLISLCTYGGEYGARGIAEDVIEIEPNLLVHTRTGGSAWMWHSETGLRLSPLQTIFENGSGSWIFGPNWEGDTWNWETFSGHVGWWAPLCLYDSYGNLDDSDRNSDDDHSHSEEDLEEFPSYGYSPIPQVEIDPAPQTDDWKSFSLASCALAIESDGTQGFIAHGTPGAKSDATMNVVMLSGREMLIEISDDLWVAEAKSWIFTDHVELWMGQKRGYMGCIEKDQTTRQWGIRLSDGRIFPAYGSPEDAPSVEIVEVLRADGNKSVRLRLTLPEEAAGLTVVYSDSDDGKTQERLIATSELQHGRVETLGRVREIPSDRAVCKVIDMRLEVERTETFPPD